MFYYLEKHNRISIKIAVHLKFPYACGTNTAFKENTDIRVPGIYNTILPVKEAECNGLRYRTYARPKNNTIYYYNHIFSNNAINIDYPDAHYLFWFMIDITKDTYQPIDFTKTNYLTRKGKSLLFALKNKFYIISSGIYKKDLIKLRHPHDYVAIIEMNSKKELYLEDRRNNLYLDFLYPVANRIVPVLQFNKSGMHVHFVDLISGQINTVSWTLDEIWQMIIDILGKVENLRYYRKKVPRGTFKEIDSVQLHEERYSYASSEENFKYVEEVEKIFEITIKTRKIKFQLSGLRLDIQFYQDSLLCYLDLYLAILKIDDKPHVLYNNYYEKTRTLLKKSLFHQKYQKYICLTLYIKTNVMLFFITPNSALQLTAVRWTLCCTIRHYSQNSQPIDTKTICL